MLVAAFFLQAQSAQKDVLPIAEIKNLQSTILNEKRTLNIYLPEAYNPDSSKTYPVIYLLDGSANEDFMHIAGLVQFLVMSDLMPPTIVVGIANVDRKRDFTFPTTIAQDLKDYPTTGSSEKFMRFIEMELQNFIDKNYKTNGIKTIIGQSLGGLLAVEILLKKPQLFTKYIIVSPSLWWDNESLLIKCDSVLKVSNIKDKKIYLTVGDEHKIMVKDANTFNAKLKQYLAKTNQLRFDYFPKENHATILHIGAYEGLKWLNPKEQ
jgi:predicted alpha/beta superfamily hydrolase